MKFYDTLMQAILRHVRFDGKCVNEWVWQLHTYMYTVASVLLLLSAFMLHNYLYSCQVCTGCQPWICEGEILYTST